MKASSESRARTLVKLIQSAKSTAELTQLLQDLLTPAELKDIEERWKILTALLEGKSQRQVQKEVGVSISKVTRASHVLQEGSGIFEKLHRR